MPICTPVSISLRCIALSGPKHGLWRLSQNAIRFSNRVGYHGYEGITDSSDERERIVAALGRNRALVMRYHDITTVGTTAREAFSLIAGGVQPN
jgi:ribulose-5-phosphate 4-epimerase/fuculose-1-phosphate aldolase